MISFKKYLEEALSLDNVNKTPGKNKVVVMMGRFQPPTIAHLDIIEKAYKKYKLPVIIAIVKSKNKNSPFSVDIIKKMIKESIKGKIEFLELSSGFIGDFISPLRDKNLEPTILFAGSDRIKSYENQIERYKELFDLNLTVEEIKRNDDDVSASKVRDALKNNDEESFKKLMSKNLHKYFKKLKGMMV